MPELDATTRAHYAEELKRNPLLTEALDRMEREATERLIGADTADTHNVLKAQCLVAAVREFKEVLERVIREKDASKLSNNVPVADSDNEIPQAAE